MGFVSEKVKINVGYVEAFRKKRNISGIEFSESLGFNNNWWSKNKQIGYIKPNVAKLMCTIYPLEYDKLVISEEKPVKPVAEEPAHTGIEEEYLPLIAAAMNATSNAMHEVHNALKNLNEKMDTMLALWK